MISAEHRYLFDLNGYVVVQDAISQEMLRRLNSAIDRLGLDRKSGNIYHSNHYGTPLELDPAFRELIDNPRLMPYLTEWVGDGYPGKGNGVRLDHAYFIFSEPGEPKTDLHLGGTPYIPAASYHLRNGRIYSALTVVSYVLTDVPPGKGGFACVPGSHKANFPCPESYYTLADLAMIASPPVRPGDAIIFTEALTHGTLPWSADHQRRALFYKYAPAHMAWMRCRWPEALLELCDEQQRAMLSPPQVADEPQFFGPAR